MLEFAVGAVVAGLVMFSCGVIFLFADELRFALPQRRLRRAVGLFVVAALPAVVLTWLTSLYLEEVLACVAGFLIFWLVALVVTEVAVVLKSRTARSKIRPYRRGDVRVGLPANDTQVPEASRRAINKLRWRPLRTVRIVYKR